MNLRHWQLKLRASSLQEPQRLLRFLSGVISACGGLILNRNCSCAGLVQLTFEFERGSCLEIYTAMLASELILSPESHLCLTELCQRTHHLSPAWWSDLAAVELEVQTASPLTLPDLDPLLFAVA